MRESECKFSPHSWETTSPSKPKSAPDVCTFPHVNSWQSVCTALIDLKTSANLFLCRRADACKWALECVATRGEHLHSNAVLRPPTYRHVATHSTLGIQNFSWMTPCIWTRRRSPASTSRFHSVSSASRQLPKTRKTFLA